MALNSPFEAQPGQLQQGSDQQQSTQPPNPSMDVLGESNPSRSPAADWTETLAKQKPIGSAQAQPSPSEGVGEAVLPVAARVAGQVGGAALGGAIGGPIGAVAGAGAGTALAGAAADKIKELYNKANNIQDLDQRNALTTALTDFVTGAFPEFAVRAITSPVVSAGAKASMSAIASAASDISVLKAHEVMRTQAEIEQATGVKIPVRMDQLFQNSDEANSLAQKMYNQNPGAIVKTQEDAKDAVIAAWTKVKNHVSDVTSRMKDGDSIRDYSSHVIEGYENNIGALARKGVELAKDRQFPNETGAILGTLRTQLENQGIKFNENGLITDTSQRAEGAGPMIRQYLDLYNNHRNLASAFQQPGTGIPSSSPKDYTPMDPAQQNQSFKNLPPNPSGSAQSGMTLGEIEKLRFKVKELANFDSINPSVSEKAFQKVYGGLADQRDSALQKVFGDNQDMSSLNDLQRTRYAYSNEKDDLLVMQNLLKKDPSNAAKILIKDNNPDQVKRVWSVAGPSVRETLKGQFLDSIAEGRLNPSDEFTQNSSIDSRGLAAKWNGVDPKIKNILYSKEDQALINKTINMARAVSSKQFPTVAAIQTDKTAQQFLGMVKILAGKFTNVPYKMIGAMVNDSPKLRDLLDSQVFLNDSVMLKPGAEKIPVSHWTKAADALQKFRQPISGAAGALIQGGRSYLSSPDQNQTPPNANPSDSGQNQ